MRSVLILLFAGACTTSEHSIYGLYQTNYDGVSLDGGGGSVVEVTATDDTGLLDDVFFRDASAQGAWHVSVPDGAVAVDLKFKQFTTDGNDRYLEAIADGPVTGDIDAGMMVISQ